MCLNGILFHCRRVLSKINERDSFTVLAADRSTCNWSIFVARPGKYFVSKQMSKKHRLIEELVSERRTFTI